MPFVGELRIFPWATVPAGWLPCDGRTLPIDQHQALYAAIGTIYGGDGQTTLALPDLRGRVPLGSAPRVPAGQSGGEETHTLTEAEIASHTHLALGSIADAATAQPNGALLGGAPIWGPPAADVVTLNAATVAPTGGNQPHENMQPYLALSICIAVEG